MSLSSFFLLLVLVILLVLDLASQIRILLVFENVSAFRKALQAIPSAFCTIRRAVAFALHQSDSRQPVSARPNIETAAHSKRRAARNFEKTSPIARGELSVSFRNVERNARRRAIELILGRAFAEIVSRSSPTQPQKAIDSR